MVKSGEPIVRVLGQRVWLAALGSSLDELLPSRYVCWSNFVYTCQ